MARRKETTGRVWRVLRGMHYPTADGVKRAEAGDVVDDLKGPSVPWLVERGVIEPADEEATS